MTLSSSWFEKARELCIFGRAFASCKNQPELDLRFRILLSTVEKVKEQRKRLVLVGPFSAGKTTVLNALMVGSELRLPTGLSETTAIPTLVRPADRVAMFLWQQDRLVEASKPVFEEFLSLTRDKVGPILEMYLRTHDEVVLHVPMHKSLKDVEFVDLPGLLGSDSKLDAKAFLHAVAADGVLYVINAKQGITRSDIGFIERIGAEGVRVLLVVTHLDQIPPSSRTQVIKAIERHTERFTDTIEEILQTDPNATGERLGKLRDGDDITLIRFIERQQPLQPLVRNFGKLLEDLGKAASIFGEDANFRMLFGQANQLFSPISKDAPVAQIEFDISKQKSLEHLELEPSQSKPGTWVVAAHAANGVISSKEVPLGFFPVPYDIELYESSLETAIFAFGIMVLQNYLAASTRRTLLRNASWLHCGFSAPNNTLVVASAPLDEEGFLQGWHLQSVVYDHPKKRDVECEWAFSAISGIGRCDYILSFGSPSWGTAVKIRGEWHIVINGEIVAGPFVDAYSPVFPPSGDRFASVVRVPQGGYTIAYSEKGSVKKWKLFPTTFDIVSNPCFLIDGSILFAGLHGKTVSVHRIPE